MLPIKNSMAACPPILNNAILGTGLKRGSSIQFTTTSIKVNNNIANDDDAKPLSASRSRPRMGQSSFQRPSSIRSISTSETAASFLSRMRTAKNKVDMALFQLKGVPNYLIRPSIKKRPKTIGGTIGQILCPKPDKSNSLNLEEILDDRWQKKNLGYALKCQIVEDDPGVPAVMFRDCSRPTFSCLLEEASLPPIFIEEGVEKPKLCPEVRAEVKAMVSDAVASVKSSYSEKWDVSQEVEDLVESKTLGFQLAQNSDCENWPVLSVEEFSVGDLPLFDRATVGEDPVKPEQRLHGDELKSVAKTVESIQTVSKGSFESEPRVEELKNEIDAPVVMAGSPDAVKEVALPELKVIPPVVTEDALSENWSEGSFGAESRLEELKNEINAPLVTAGRPDAVKEEALPELEAIPPVAIEDALPENWSEPFGSESRLEELKNEINAPLMTSGRPDAVKEVALPELEAIPPVVIEDPLSENWADAIVGFSPREIVWKNIDPIDSYKVVEESRVEHQQVITTKVKPRPKIVVSESSKTTEHITEVPCDRSPVTRPRSVLDIIDPANRTGVYIQTELYITNHILDELKKKKSPEKEKTPVVPKAEAISLYEDNSHLIERQKETLSPEALTLPLEKLSEVMSLVPLKHINSSPPIHPKPVKGSMNFSKDSRVPPTHRKSPSVDVNVETVIKCFSDRAHSQLSVTEYQKYVDSRLPYPFCTESNLQITGSNEALNNGIKAVETAKAKLVTLGKVNETNSNIRGNVHLNHMLSDIKEPVKGSKSTTKKKKTTKTVPIQSVNLSKTPHNNTELSPQILQAKIKQVLEANPPKKLASQRDDLSAFHEDNIQVLSSRMIQKMFGSDVGKVKPKSKFVMKPPKSSPVPFKSFPKKVTKEETCVSEKWEVRDVKEDVIELLSGGKKKVVNLVESDRSGDVALMDAETNGSLNKRDKQILRNIIRDRLKRALRQTKQEADHREKIVKSETKPLAGKFVAPKMSEKEADSSSKSTATLNPPNPATGSALALTSRVKTRDSYQKPSSAPSAPESSKPLTSEEKKQPASTSAAAVMSNSAETSIPNDNDGAVHESEIIIIKNDNPAAKPVPKPSTREIIYIINDANRRQEPPKTPVDSGKKIGEPSLEKSQPESLDSKKPRVVVKSQKFKPSSKNPVSSPVPVVNRSEVKAKDTILEKGSTDKEKSKNVIDVIKETSTGESSIGRVTDLGSLVPPANKTKIEPTEKVEDSEPNKNFTPAGMFMGLPRRKLRPLTPPVPVPPSDPLKSSEDKSQTKPEESKVSSVQDQPRARALSAVSSIQKITNFPLVNAAKSLNLAREAEANVLSINFYKDPELRLKLASVPSVTKVLNATMSEKSKLALLKWRKNKIAEIGEEGFLKYYAEQLQKGTDFHAAVQRYLLAKCVEKKDSLDDVADVETNLPLKSIADVLKNIRDVRVLESHVVHSKLQYRGVIDCVAKYRDKPVVIEWKRSDKPKPTVKHTYDAPVQLSAYIGAMNFDDNYEIPVTGGLVVIAYSDGSPADIYQLPLTECQKYWKMWLARLKDYLTTKSEVAD